MHHSRAGWQKVKEVLQIELKVLAKQEKQKSVSRENNVTTQGKEFQVVSSSQNQQVFREGDQKFGKG